MAEEQNNTDLRLEDWIGERVTVNLLRGPAAAPGAELMGIRGTLVGVDPMGIILLFDPRDVYVNRQRAAPPPNMGPRKTLFPWRRIELIELLEAEEAWPDFY